MAIIKRRRSDGSIAYGVQGPDGQWEGTRDRHSDARQLEREAFARRPTRGEESCESFATRWPDDYAMKNGEQRWQPSTDYSNRIAVRRFARKFGETKLARLPDDRRFIPWANSLPPSVAKTLRTMFNDAKDSKLIAENPMPRDGAQSKGRSRIEAITEDELDLLGRCALEEHGAFGLTARAYVIWQGTVGTRPVAVRHLKREHVDLDRGEVYLLWPGKNVAPRTVFIPPKAVEAVSAMPRRIDSEWLFTTVTGRRLTKSSEFYIWKGIRSRFEAALPPERARQLRDARRDRGAMDLYELRHAAATSLRRRGASWEEIAWQLGQTDKGVQAQKVYSHLTDIDHMAGLRSLFGENVTDLREAREASNG